MVIGLIAALSAQAPAAINLELRPAAVSEPVIGGPVQLGLYAVSDDETTQLLSALQAIIHWDPQKLQLMGLNADGAVPLLSSGFPADPFGLNEANPPQDGNGMYVAFAPLAGTVSATPAGALITTFEFQPVAPTPSTTVEIAETDGDPPGNTIVFDGVVPNLDVTGTLSAAKVEITPCCPPDLNGDCVVDTIDFLALLAAWGTDSGGPPDLNGDGVVDTIDFLGLLAAWGPCP